VMDFSVLHSALSIPVCLVLGWHEIDTEGFETVTPKPQTTFFDTAFSEGLLQADVFTADLKKGAPGSYDFGFIDSTKYTGSITYVP